MKSEQEKALAAYILKVGIGWKHQLANDLMRGGSDLYRGKFQPLQDLRARLGAEIFIDSSDVCPVKSGCDRRLNNV